MSALKRTDVALLEAAKKTNGGGIPAYWPTPQATAKRLLTADLLKRKPGEPWMLIITKTGREALATTQTESKQP